MADRLVVTELADAFEGDTYAPEVGPEWVPDVAGSGMADLPDGAPVPNAAVCPSAATRV